MRERTIYISSQTVQPIVKKVSLDKMTEGKRPARNPVRTAFTGTPIPNVAKIITTAIVQSFNELPKKILFQNEFIIVSLTE